MVGRKVRLASFFGAFMVPSEYRNPMPHMLLLIAMCCVICARTTAAPPDSVFITEIMFNVPKGDDGDANADGIRDASADEFVELHNPTADAIQLAGYTITSRLSTGDPKSTKGVRFTFPEFELPALGMVVVFNGYKATIPGPVGTPVAAPDSPNPSFAGAFVFTMNTARKNNTFANSGDYCLLSGPQGHPIDCIVWGDPDPPPPAGVDLQDVHKDPKGSVQRADPKAAFHPHRDINTSACSPGEIPPAQ